MRKSVVWLTLSVSLLLAPLGQAFALEIGAIQVRSYLDEPLVATIPVRVDNIQQRESLAATLAPETEYVARGLQPLAEADDLIVQVVEGGNIEQMLIELRSLSELNAPYLGLVLQLSWNGGGQVQEFTVLLDPRPGTTAEAAPASEAPPAEQAAAEPVGLAPPADEVIAPRSEQPLQSQRDAKLEQLARDMNSSAPNGAEPQMRMPGEPDVVIRKVSPDAYLAGESASGSTPSSSDQVIIQKSSPGGASASRFSGDSYGPVGAGETLWSIATLARPSDDISMQQVMSAIHAANPQAFDGGYNTLRKGAMLSIPSAQAMRTASAKPSVPSKASKSSASKSSSQTAKAATSSKPAKAEPVKSQAATETAPLPEETSIWNAAELEADKQPVDSAEREQKGGLVTKSGSLPQPTGDTADATAAQESAAQDKAPADAGQVDYSALDATSTEVAAETAAAPEAEGESAAEAAAGETPADADAGSEAAEQEVDETATQASESASAQPEEDTAATAGSDNTLKLAAVILLVILLTYWLFRRRRNQSDGGSTTTYVPPIPEDEVEDSDYRPTPQFADEPVDASIAAAVGEEDDALEAGSSDPVLDQVDTYLSYGLYESAADSLDKAIEAEPERADLRMKLLETHEAAGNQDEFVAAVQDWQSSNNPPSEADRGNIEAMGQSIAPGVALFAVGAGMAAAVTTEQEEAEATPGPFEADLADESLVEDDLPTPDFDLDEEMELDLPADEPDTSTDREDSEAASVALNLDDDFAAGLENDQAETEPDAELELPDLDLDLGDTPAAAPSEPAAAATPDDGALDLNLDDLDFGTANVESEEPAPAREFDEAGLDLSLDDEPEEAAEAEGEADESEFDVKLDLAQAYLEMGEPDLAKGLLDEVVEGGNESQRSKAQTLLQDID